MAATLVRRVEADGRVAWRKTYSDGGTRRRLAALRWVARRLGANALLAPMPLSPELACRTEQAMINRLARTLAMLAMLSAVPAIAQPDLKAAVVKQVRADLLKAS